MTSPATDAPRTLHKTITSHKGAVNVVRYAKGNAKYALSGGRDRLIKLWNRETAMDIKTYSGHGYEVLCIDV